jgi:hypothetical protein
MLKKCLLIEDRHHPTKCFPFPKIENIFKSTNRKFLSGETSKLDCHGIRVSKIGVAATRVAIFYFDTNFFIVWKASKWKVLVYFVAVWYILRQFGMF